MNVNFSALKFKYLLSIKFQFISLFMKKIKNFTPSFHTTACYFDFTLTTQI